MVRVFLLQIVDNYYAMLPYIMCSWRRP